MGFGGWLDSRQLVQTSPLIGPASPEIHSALRQRRAPQRRDPAAGEGVRGARSSGQSGSIEGGADPVAVVIVSPLGASARCAVIGGLRRGRRPDQSACAAPIAAPASVPPALPPDTADPTRAPVPAPSAPPTTAFCCCGVRQADTDRAVASASARAIIFCFIGWRLLRPRFAHCRGVSHHNRSKAGAPTPCAVFSTRTGARSFGEQGAAFGPPFLMGTIRALGALDDRMRLLPNPRRAKIARPVSLILGGAFFKMDACACRRLPFASSGRLRRGSFLCRFPSGREQAA